MAHQMHNTGLDGCIRERGIDGVWEASANDCRLIWLRCRACQLRRLKLATCAVSYAGIWVMA
jgi:hypothetical protein